ncbi:LacI family DNA-binding transcriptional regulator [Hoeflea prorocentri]|uniref:LacI family DNA-binding transcriptional regulator n=1 Tax=Hoeflea prorocentri TaxID=1922333 RepID=A0A9X3UEL2_9HYPH|nr:LacI family DNA-binding transcriptional regulator [Hoeflea prorocentri]MCY6379419.1 LacI family DNA-binding transcriptional regulator [Hoeflea prorocentri]MDA5397220.1 LacI family DNA-binding transcriptional regulator [Hoeflea prorocentri]
MATMAQIARKAGVSPAVVSRVISNDATLRISKETRERVHAAIREMNYSPNVAAQSLVSSRTGTIAIVVHDMANPVYGEILRGAQSEAAIQNKAIVLGDASVSPQSNSRLAQLIGGGGVDGLILQAAGVRSDDYITRAVHNKVPIVLLQADLEIDAHLISLPDEDAAYLATRHLLDLGHKKIACLAGEPGLTFAEARLKGWRSAMGALSHDHLIAHCAPDTTAGEVAMRELLERDQDVTGLVCFNVVSAIGALRVARAAGFRIPEDLSIVAIHDVKFAEDLKVPLTVVAMPLSELGQEAVKMVCTPPPEPKSRLLLDHKPELILRESTTIPRT